MGKITDNQAIMAGMVSGVLFGCLITWYPIRLSFCASYNAPDCEEIVLMVFPLYCFIGPAIGGLIGHFLTRARSNDEVE